MAQSRADARLQVAAGPRQGRQPGGPSGVAEPRQVVRARIREAREPPRDGHGPQAPGAPVAGFDTAVRDGEPRRAKNRISDRSANGIELRDGDDAADTSGACATSPYHRVSIRISRGRRGRDEKNHASGEPGRGAPPPKQLVNRRPPRSTRRASRARRPGSSRPSSRRRRTSRRRRSGRPSRASPSNAQCTRGSGAGPSRSRSSWSASTARGPRRVISSHLDGGDGVVARPPSGAAATTAREPPPRRPARPRDPDRPSPQARR